MAFSLKWVRIIPIILQKTVHLDVYNHFVVEQKNLSLRSPCDSVFASIWSRGVTRVEVWIGNWIYWTLTLVTTNNYDNFTELHILKFTVITAHRKSQSFLAVAW
jgi:hypothetical protein